MFSSKRKWGFKGVKGGEKNILRTFYAKTHVDNILLESKTDPKAFRWEKKDIPKCFKAKVDDVHACLIQIVFNTKIDSTPLSWDKLKIQSYLICFNAFVERYNRLKHPR